MYFHKQIIGQILEICGVKFDLFPQSFQLNSTPNDVLTQDQINNIINKFSIIGIDGTAGELSPGDSYSPIWLSVAAVEYDINEIRKYTNQFLMDPSYGLSYSTIRTAMELRSLICLLKAKKFKRFDCDQCPLQQFGCTWPLNSSKPWDNCSKKTSIGIFDLPVSFAFIKIIPTLNEENRNFLLETINYVFREIQKHNLPVIFITQKQMITTVIQEITNEFDRAINLQRESRQILEWVQTLLKEEEIKLHQLQNLKSKIKKENITDFDFFEQYFTSIGQPSPVFKLNPSEYTNYWDEIKFHYFSWGYNENTPHGEQYIITSWSRIGYSPAISSEDAQLVILYDQFLGGGHPLSLLMAHSTCNFNRSKILHTLRSHYNSTAPPNRQLGYNLKEITKWRFY